MLCRRPPRRLKPAPATRRPPFRCLIRDMATKAEGDLKKHLRKFYRRVHPDLFTARPAERSVNEASFKQLMCMMQEAESDTALPAGVLLDAVYDERDNLAGTSPLSRKATVRSVLHSLLTQSGLLSKDEGDDVEPQSAVEELRETLKKSRRDENSGRDIISEPASIISWVHTYSEVARERREAYARLDREVGLLRSMLMISFQVRLAYDVGSTPLSLEEQADLVAHLHDSITAGVHGCTVCLVRTRYTPPIDPAGRLALPISEPHTWVELLKSVDGTALRLARQRYEDVLVREKACAGVLGLGVVTAESFNFSTTLDYDGFLRDVERAGAEGRFAQLNKNLYHQLTLKVRQMSAAEFQPSLDPLTGFVVGCDTSPSDLEWFLRESSPTAIRSFKQHDMTHKRDDDTLRFVRRQLMAHGIKKHEIVQPAQMREALARLRSLESEISPYLRSVDLMIGALYRVHGDGTLEVPWDFSKR